MRIVLIIFLTFFFCGNSKYTRISSKPANIVFQYREGTTGELSLKECQHNEACNVVYKRFWMPNLAQRLCRCSDGIECPWSAKFDNNSMILNNRSYLKFCNPVNDTNICKPRQKAAIVNGRIDDELKSMSAHNVTVNCLCPKNYYWKLSEYSYNENQLYQIFKCAKQRKCFSYDFCGFVRADFFSVYYRCSCPEGNICITNYKETENIQEFMYAGDGYEAYCDPWNSTSKYY